MAPRAVPLFPTVEFALPSSERANVNVEKGGSMNTCTVHDNDQSPSENIYARITAKIVAAHQRLVLPAWSRWTPRRKWPVLLPVRLAARDRAPVSRQPANSRQPWRGPHRSPPRSVAPASPCGRVQEPAAASADPRRCSSGRGTTGPSPSSTSRSRQLMAGFAVSINGWIWVSTKGPWTARRTERRVLDITAVLRR